MFAIKNRETLPTNVLESIQDLAVRIRALFLVEHSEDGTHIVESRDLAFTPVGSMLDWPTATAPSGWKICDGAQLNRVTYKALFDVISTTFGAGDGSTTFNLPDKRGRFALGKAAAGTGATIGATGGALDHAHTGPSHTHVAGTLAGPSHTHPAGTLAGPSHDHSTPNHTHTVSGSTANESAHTHSVDPPSTQLSRSNDQFVLGAGDFAVLNVPAPTIDVTSFTSGAGSAHSHGAGTLAAASGGASTTGSSGTGSVTGSTAAAGTGAVTGSTGAAGTGDTGTNNPAFIVLGHTIIFTGVAA